jgi:hypothetical protein
MQDRALPLPELTWRRISLWPGVFRYIGFQLGVTVNAIENLAALPLVGVFEQVSDLRRFELAQWA